MITLLWIVYILDCLLLIGIILLQPGEGADLAGAFGGAASQTAFGARGSATFMQKLTTGLAVLFMVLSILLVILTNMKQKNIMERNLPATSSTPAAAPAKPAAQSPAPAQAPAQGTTQSVPITVPAAPADKAPAQPEPAKPAPAPAKAPAQPAK